MKKRKDPMVQIMEDEVADYWRWENMKQATFVCLMAVLTVVFWVIVFAVFFTPKAADACSGDITELTSETQTKLQQLKEEASASGIEFKVICTYRSQAEQDALYAKGRTEPGAKVTWTQRSAHTTRRAFDVVVLDRSGKADWKGESYLSFGDIAARVGLVWGGDWKVRDYGHFELR